MKSDADKPPEPDEPPKKPTLVHRLLRRLRAIRRDLEPETDYRTAGTEG